ncbi:hypothetical protein SOVF_058890 [Spinacia oleracea]|nr:hypothetical protein SOVF_058890 [Spinacia oleracea]
MAEAIISEVVSTIIEKLGSGAYKKLVYAKDLDSHITTLQELKTTIEATLVDAETLETCSNSQQDVLNKLRTALTELDDFLEELADKAELKQFKKGNKLSKPVRLFFSESNQLVSPLRDATKLKTILKKFDCIARNHAKYGSIVISSPPVNYQNRKWRIQMASSSILNSLFVGRDKDRDNIRVKGCFDAQFWVSVTPDFNVEAVLRKMVDCGMGELSHNCNAVQLYHHFIQAIGGKKFLLVLDNIWDHASLREKWVDLKSLLEECGANGSKVLLTTSNKKVAKLMDSMNPYKLEGLTKDGSCLLFQKIAFTQYQEPGVEVIGMEISKMCPNMPLVIQNVAGILARKRTVREWQAFRDEQFADFASYGSDVERTLKLSYDQLDESLKRCVKFCTLFEKGGFFHLEQMIHRWIALGYVKPQYKSQRLEEAGEEYMLSLQDFGFLEIDSFDQFGFIRDFKMHDVMYELVLSLAGVKYKAADSNTDKILLGRAFLISVFESAALLPNLISLVLKWCDNVEYIEDNLVDDQLAPAPLFPMLSELEVYGMPKLKGWWRMSSSRGESGDQDSTELLEIQQHQNHNLVNQKPAFLALFMLIVYYVQLTIIIATQQIQIFTSLSVSRMHKLKEWWRMWSSGDEHNSRKLIQVQKHQNHYLVNCKPAFPILSSLTVDNVELAVTIARRKIYNHEYLVIGNHWSVWQPGQQRQELTLLSSYFSNLQSLRLHHINGLEVLPESIRHLSSLDYLGISKCEQLKEIPEWIDSLTALDRLDLSDCPRLESLPQQISNLPNLKILQIYECPILKERCKSPDGEYWSFIQHISHVFIRHERNWETL